MIWILRPTILVCVFFSCQSMTTGSPQQSTQENRRNVPELTVSSNILLGKPAFNGQFGPYEVGSKLNLTCSVSNDEPVYDLSWWIKDNKISDLTIQNEHTTSNSLYFSAGLADADDEYIYVCRSEILGISTTVKLIITNNHKSKVDVNDNDEINTNIKHDKSKSNKLFIENTKKTNEHKQRGPEMTIASSILLGKPIFGGLLGPYESGQPLTLTCSVKSKMAKDVSWWLGNTQLNALQERNGKMYSSSHTIKKLSIRDNLSEYTCKSKALGISKTATLKVFDIERVPELNLESNILLGKPIFDGQFGPYKPGQTLTLTCSVKSDQAIDLRWWDGDNQLNTNQKHEGTASSSSYTISKLDIQDNGATFVCKSEALGISKTAILSIEETTEVPDNPIPSSEANNSVQEWINNPRNMMVILYSLWSFAAVILVVILCLVIYICIARKRMTSNVYEKLGSNISATNEGV